MSKIIPALSTLVRAAYLDGAPSDDLREQMKEQVCAARAEYDALRARIAELEAALKDRTAERDAHRTYGGQDLAAERFFRELRVLATHLDVPPDAPSLDVGKLARESVLMLRARLTELEAQRDRLASALAAVVPYREHRHRIPGQWDDGEDKGPACAPCQGFVEAQALLGQYDLSEGAQERGVGMRTRWRDR
jgi:BMFP domain-containing protein YqiC